MAGQKRLGELLVEMGFIDSRTLHTSLEEQKRTHRRLGKILVEMGAITEERLVRALSLQLGVEVCDPIASPVHQRVRMMVTAELAHRCRVIPIAVRRDDAGQSLFVATADPLDRGVLDVLRSHVGGGTRIRWMLAGETEIELALARHYGTEPPRAGSHYPPPGQPVFEAPMTSALPPRHMPPVIQGVPLSAGRVGGPSSAPSQDIESNELELVPLTDMLPSLNVRGRPPSVVPPPPSSQSQHPHIVRGARSESSPPPITRDIPVPQPHQFEKRLEDPLHAGTIPRVGLIGGLPAHVPVEHEHVLTPDDAIEDALEPIDSGDPINGSAPDFNAVMIEEPATLDPDTMPPVAIRLRDLPPLNIEESGPVPVQPRSHLIDRTGDRTSAPPAPLPPVPPMFTSPPAMAGSWGDLFHGTEVHELGFQSPVLAPTPAEAEPRSNGTPTFDIDVDSEATPFLGTSPLSPMEPLQPASTSQVTLEPDVISSEDIPFPAPGPDTELIAPSAPDDIKWNMALAEAAAEAMAEAEISFDTPPLPISMSLSLEPSEDVTEVPPEHREEIAVLDQTMPPPPHTPPPLGSVPVRVPVPVPVPIESEAQKLRKTLIAFIAGDELDPATSKYAMRVIAALMLSDGMFDDDDRLTRALAMIKSRSSGPGPGPGPGPG